MDPLVFSIKRHGTMAPLYKRYGDAGIDLRSAKHFFCKPGRNKVPNGICFKMIPDTEGSVRPRSGNNNEGVPGVTLDAFYKKCGENITTWAATAGSHFGGDNDMTYYDMLEKFIEAHDDVVFNEDELQRFDADVLVGTIDETYTGEINTSIKSHEKNVFIIPRNVRISQLVISPVVHARLIEGEVAENAVRGSQGFGSSGVM